jgi:hypothetical protein
MRFQRYPWLILTKYVTVKAANAKRTVFAALEEILRAVGLGLSHGSSSAALPSGGDILYLSSKAKPLMP